MAYTYTWVLYRYRQVSLSQSTGHSLCSAHLLRRNNLIDRTPTLFQNHHEPRTTNCEARTRKYELRIRKREPRSTNVKCEAQMSANREPRSTNEKREAQMTANREPRTAKHEPRSTNEKREAQMTANREPRTKNANVLLGHRRYRDKMSTLWFTPFYCSKLEALFLHSVALRISK